MSITPIKGQQEILEAIKAHDPFQHHKTLSPADLVQAEIIARNIARWKLEQAALKERIAKHSAKLPKKQHLSATLAELSSSHRR